ncbi:hypothetical protein BD779DRAFT_1463482 [Infundibulicybe gibba]|nr:hypothetical protein BD779DRAFT_1463482 [Infundibulicybe gibba]
MSIRRYKLIRNQDAPLLEWLPKREEYLSEFLRLEGRGDMASFLGCIVCNEMDPELLFRCEDCFNIRLTCKSCTIHLHRALPLHRIKQWNGLYFAKQSLKHIGLRIQLGHHLNQPCPNPVAAPGDDFVVIHTNGIHCVGLDFCNCGRSQNHHIQLLRARFFPATTLAPKTAATFEVLHAFQMTSFMSKISGFEYYHALARITNNLGVTPPDRYPAFLRMVREWRHIKLMKRMGRGHDTGGIDNTPEGSCAVLCPACPHPGKNLPENWQSAPPDKSWLYALFVGIDANFRLKRLDVSSNARDPGLNKGYSYVVEEKKFKEFLKDHVDGMPSEKSTCNNHDAIKSAAMRGGQGIASSGIGTIECSRHNTKRATSVGHLQRGEKYPNMDYIFLSSLKQDSPKRVVVSYDIACQWSVNLARQCSLYPDGGILEEHDFVYVITKWHMAAHRLKCHTEFSFYYTPWVGRTDGEAPERGWAASNGLASSTKEMGPGSRRDTLDDYFGDYNWRKTIGLGPTLLRKVKEAGEERAGLVIDFLELSASIAKEYPQQVMQWTADMQAWEQDPTKTNPFTSPIDKISENAVRLELAREEELAMTLGQLTFFHDEISPSMLLTQGIEIEDQQ